MPAKNASMKPGVTPPAARRIGWIAALAVSATAIIALAVALWPPSRGLLSAAPGRTPAPAAAIPAPRYVGETACAACHRSQAEAWLGSQHAHAMQPATRETVLGKFDGARFTYN